MESHHHLIKKGNFTKMHGTGNSFLITHHNGQSIQQLQQLSKKLCDHNFGIGADGLLVVFKSTEPLSHKFHMKVFNHQGSIGRMCGNGIRCFAAYLREHAFEQKDEFGIGTDSGVKSMKVFKQNKGYQILVDIGETDNIQKISDISKQIKENLPAFIFNSAHYIYFNNPHLVINVPKMPSDEDLRKHGQILQKMYNANINFVETKNDQQFEIRTFELGAGLTLACGTGSCASFVIHTLHKPNCESAKAINAGGILTISKKGNSILKQGPSEFICSGIYEV